MSRRPVDKRTEFGERLAQARASHESRLGRPLTQTEISLAVGLSQTGVSFAENRAEGSPKVVHFARLYRVDPWWLASGEGVMSGASTARDSLSVWAIRLAEMFDALPLAEQPDAYSAAQAALRPKAAATSGGTPPVAGDTRQPRRAPSAGRARAK